MEHICKVLVYKNRFYTRIDERVDRLKLGKISRITDIFEPADQYLNAKTRKMIYEYFSSARYKISFGGLVGASSSDLIYVYMPNRKRRRTYNLCIDCVYLTKICNLFRIFFFL